MIRRPPRSTLSSSSAASDVYKRQGLHPSFTAGGDGTLINTENNRLTHILGKKVSMSRFHYLRLNMPGSYNDILKAGFSEDYSMGYPDEPGFRAGLARPYFFYNVSEDKPVSYTHLRA